jgi:hypothetical protein
MGTVTKYVTEYIGDDGLRYGDEVEAVDWDAAQRACDYRRRGERVLGTHVADVAPEHFPGFWAELTGRKEPS